MSSSRTINIVIVMLITFSTSTFGNRVGYGAPPPPMKLAPVASFNYAPAAPVVNQAVQFTDTSTNFPTSWFWSFGDGLVSRFRDPSHRYMAAGSYTVALTAISSKGVNTMTRILVVNGSGPVASFRLTPESPLAGQTVNFTDSSTNDPTTWSWNFGDGGTSLVRNPEHIYTQGGAFTITLVVANGTGSGTFSRTLTVRAAAPVAKFNFAPSDPAPGQPVTFTDGSSGSPTSWSWNFGDGGISSNQNPTHTYAAIGNYNVKLVATNAGGSNTISKTVTVAATGPAFTLTQSISDQAQETTLAFSGLGMITGTFESQTFFPPGKVADYTGFQYLRDNDPDRMGHNTSFLTRVAYNVIYVLNDTQFEQLKTLAVAQQTNIDAYGTKRFPLMKAFRRQLDGEIPIGATGLNLNAVRKASRELYLIDGQISYDRAVLYASILNSLNPTQMAYLTAMKGKGWNSWPEVTKEMVDSRMKSLPQGTAVAVMTYAGDLFSWYAGSIDADVYFCPERHGTYFGSFYIKDAPAIGHEGYSINEQLTATAGSALCDSSKGYVSANQAVIVSNLVETQRQNLYGSPVASIVSVRTEIATLLRSLLIMADTAGDVRKRVLALSETYGDLDGTNNYHYATAFAQIRSTLTSDQKARLLALRKSIMSGTYADGTAFDFTICTTPYLYSSPITNQSQLAGYIGNTDWLFFEPQQ